MTNPNASTDGEQMTSAKTQSGDTELQAVEDFILQTLKERRASLPLGELARLAAVSEAHFSPDETRGAAAVLVDQGKILLTDDWQVRLVANH